ncbi:MAG TPA: PRC-barrel domain-containing protein [Bacteroidales bacterium]
MNKSDTRLIGTLTKLHSFKGRFVFVSEIYLGEEINDWESVFLEIEGLLVPFFIDYISFTSDTSAIIGFEDVDTSEKARDFVSCNVYQLKSLTGDQEEDILPSEFSGYQVIDKNKGNIGKIDKILDYNQNLLFRIVKGKKEILIPITNEIITNVNHRKKEVTINAPEGLLDL